MKTILIKMGQAVTALKREGLSRGGRRILLSAGKMFRWVGSGDVLFITGGVGDSAMYRTGHVAEELAKQKIKCSVTVQDNPLLASYVGKFRIFVFHRVLFTSQVAKLVEKIKKQKKEIIFETDDLVFDPQYLKYMDYYRKMNYFEKKLYEKGVGGEILADPYVRTCTTTTAYLASKLGEYRKRVFIAPNRLSDKDLETVEKISRSKLIQKANSQAQNFIKIGYFSGTLSHNRDFACITRALFEIMEKYAQVKLLLVGPLDIEEKLEKFKKRIERLPYVPREKHFENIAQVDINLAPLEIGNPFCEAKSELKFFEAGVLGVPTIASATETFRKAIEDGVDGYVAVDEKDWFEKLEKLVLDEELRKEMGERAREKTLEKYTNRNAQNEQYYAYLKKILFG